MNKISYYLILVTFLFLSRQIVATEILAGNKDVIVIGAGTAGASSAREFYSWNKEHENNTIDFAVLEALDRIGGRVLDVELGKIANPSRYSGGFRNPVESREDMLVGCHCDDTCEQYNVEVGAGWLTGLKGIEGKARIISSRTLSTTSSPYSPLCKRNTFKKTKVKKGLKKNIKKKHVSWKKKKGGNSLRDRWLEECPNVPLNRVFALTQGLDDANMSMNPPMLYTHNRDVYDWQHWYYDNTGIVYDEDFVVRDDVLCSFDKVLGTCMNKEARKLFWHWEYNNPSAPLPISDVGLTQALLNDKKRCASEWNWVPDLFSQKQKQAANFIMNWWYYSEFTTREISFFNFPNDQPMWDRDTAYIVDQRGFKEIIYKIMPDRGSEVVKFNHEVTNVDYTGISNECQSSSYPVKVTFNDLTEGVTKYYCTKKVISTLSYGVIDYNFKEENGSFFSPKIDTGNPSPWSKMGELVKVYFRFPTKFWNDAEYITFSMEQDFKNNQTDNTVKCDYFYNLDRFFADVPDVNNIYSLFCFLSTPDLELIGVDDPSVSDEDFAEKIWHLLDPLRKAFGENYVEPNCWTFKDWGADKYFRGAYGIWKYGASYFKYEDFYKPKPLQTDPTGESVLYLSGEHSCNYLWGVVEGAFFAGLRDAQFVIKDLYPDLASSISRFSICGLQQEFNNCPWEFDSY